MSCLSIRSQILSGVVVAAMCLVSTTVCGQFEEIKLTANDAAAVDQFGRAVDISGGHLIVGAFGDDDHGSGSGSAYLYDSFGTQLFKLTASDAAGNDNFGRSVAIDGNLALVGAPQHDGSRGAAYLFDVTTGTQLFKFTASDAAGSDLFGTSVDIHNGIAIIGAPRDDFMSGTEVFDAGAAYLFDVTTGSQLRKLIASDAADFDQLGESVSIRGGTAVVGALGDDDGADGAGSAYLFNVANGSQIGKLTAPNAAVGDAFGTSVAIDNATVVVGAPRYGGVLGSAYLFDTTGAYYDELIAPEANETFGISVGVDRNHIVVGANGDGLGAGDQFGSAYVYDAQSSTLLSSLTAEDPAVSDAFGRSVAVSDGLVVVGAFGNDDAGSGSGSAHLMISQQVGLAWGDDVPRKFTVVTDATGKVRTVDSPGTTAAATVAQATRDEIRMRMEQMFYDSEVDFVTLVDGEVVGGTNLYFADPLGMGSTLLGQAFSGVDQFNSEFHGEAVVFLTGTPELDAEVAVHEVGHTFGLRHVNPPTADDPNDLELMDYDDALGDVELFINAVSEIIEPPNELNNPEAHTGVTHNPLYHLQRYVDGVSHDTLVDRGILPGGWDLSLGEGGAVDRISASLDFGDYDQELYDVLVLAGGTGREESFTELAAFASISLSELEQLTWSVEFGTGFQLLAASTSGGLLDIILATGDPFDAAKIGLVSQIGSSPALLQMVTDPQGGFTTLAAATLQGHAVPGPPATFLALCATGIILAGRPVSGRRSDR